MTDQEKFLQREIKHMDKKIEELKKENASMKKLLNLIRADVEWSNDSPTLKCIDKALKP